MKRSLHRVFALVWALAAAPAAVRADDGEEPPVVHSFPYWSGTVSVELGGDHVFGATDPGLNRNLAKLTLEANTVLHFSEAFSLVSHLTAEPVIDPEPFSNSYFKNEGLFVEELFAQYEAGGWRAYAGKFDPAFGLAWDATPGVFGTDFAEDYQLTEKLGVGLAYSFGDGAEGTHTLTVSLYKADTSVLAGSLFTKRAGLTLDDGGAGNTRLPRSFVVALSSEEVPSLGGLGYTLAFRHQAKGNGPDDVAAENGGVFGLTKTFYIAEDRSIEAIFETAYLSHADGLADDKLYLTLGAKWISGPWNASASWTLRDTLVAGAPDFADNLYQLSAGYTFENGIGIEAGYKFSREVDGDSQAIGVKVTREFQF